MTTRRFAQLTVRMGITVMTVGFFLSFAAPIIDGMIEEIRKP